MQRLRDVLRPTIDRGTIDHYSGSLRELSSHIQDYRGHIANLTVYPLKGAEGLPVSEALLSPTGLKTMGGFPDRSAMIVEWKKQQQHWERFSQRQEPGLARIHTILSSETLLRLTGDAGEELVLSPKQFAYRSGERTTAQMYKGVNVEGVLEEETGCITMFVRAHLKTIGTYTHEDLERIRVLMGSSSVMRDVPKTHTGGIEAITNFGDIGQHLLINETTVADYLNRHISGEQVSVSAFRPNITVRGWPVNLEDIITRTEIDNGTNDVFMNFGALSTRCSVTAVDQSTGERRTDREPLKTLMRIRPLREGNPTMGINVAHDAERDFYEVIHVGDVIVPTSEKVFDMAVT